MNKRTMKKGLAIVLALVMVFAMTATAFASDTITPVEVSYPMNVKVVMLAEGGTVTDVSGVTHQITGVMEMGNDDTGVPVQFTSPFSTIFTSYLPTNPGSAHQLNGYPTVMDAICKAYQNVNGPTAGISLGWDSNPSEGPEGAYLTTLFGNTTITTVSGLYRWEGYSWSIYLNETTDTWNANARSGKIPYYASNVQIQNGDTIYVMYENNVETW
ncbi:MAG: hypothetical protein ACLUJC_04740 [Clostridia bacterium]